LEDVLDGRALRGAARVRQLEGFQREHAAAIREHVDAVVISRDDEMLDVVLVARLHADDPAPAAMLLPVRGERHALRVVAAREGDDDVLVGDELLVRELAGQVVDDLGAPLVAVLLGHEVEVSLDEAEDLARAAKDRLELADELDRRLVLLVKLLALELREP